MFSKAVEIIVKDIKSDMEYVGAEEVENWNELLDALGIYSEDMKENIYYTLKENDIWMNDDYELVDEATGSVYSYRKLTNAVRKELFN